MDGTRYNQGATNMEGGRRPVFSKGVSLCRRPWRRLSVPHIPPPSGTRLSRAVSVADSSDAVPPAVFQQPFSFLYGNGRGSHGQDQVAFRVSRNESLQMFEKGLERALGKLALEVYADSMRFHRFAARRSVAARRSWPAALLASVMALGCEPMLRSTVLLAIPSSSAIAMLDIPSARRRRIRSISFPSALIPPTLFDGSATARSPTLPRGTTS
jgi:hypothetical protein